MLYWTIPPLYDCMAVMLYWTIPPLYDRMAVLLYWIMTALGYTNINAFNCTGADTMHCVVTTGCTSSYRIQSILCCHNTMHVIVSYSINIPLFPRHRFLCTYRHTLCTAVSLHHRDPRIYSSGIVNGVSFVSGPIENDCSLTGMLRPLTAVCGGRCWLRLKEI